MTTATIEAPAHLDGYTLEQRPNQLARRGCWYVRHADTGVLIGWIGLVNRTGDGRHGEGDGWSALSFAHRDALLAADTPQDPYYWTGRIVWGDEDRTADAALEALVAATGDLWLHERATAGPAEPAAPRPAKGPTRAEREAVRQGLDRIYRRRGY